MLRAAFARSPNGVGVSRYSDRHQIEFFATIGVRLCRQLSGVRLVPTHVRLAHRRDGKCPEMTEFLGREIEFGADIDEILFAPNIRDLPVVSADLYLNKLLIRYCEEALARRPAKRSSFRSSVENAIVPLLPHGKARADIISRRLGVSGHWLASVVIDGSKFKAVNNRDRNFTRAKMERRIAQIEESVARYLRQLDTADRQEPSEARTTKTTRLKEKIAKLKKEMQRLRGLKARMLAAPDQQISLTDPDSRSMATSGRGSGVVGYNVQVAVDTEHHLIVTHEVTNIGSDRAQLGRVATEAKATLERANLDVIADRGYFSSEEILKCEQAGITVTMPKPMTSNAKAEGRFGKQDFCYVAEEDVYICPAGERLAFSFTTEENGLVLHRYSTKACQNCAINWRCTTGKERRVTRWEHEHILEAVQRRLDEHPEKMRQRRETVEHPFGTIKARMGATHFLMKTLPRVASEMALHVLAYNLTRVMNIMGIQPLMAAIRTA